jgi:aspartokinase-like uncharacterized kinase
LVKVLKIGGSFLTFPSELKNLCKVLSINRKDHNLLIIPGGGIFADIVRKYYLELKLSEITSHQMAVHSMDQYGLILKEFIGKSSVLISNLDRIDASLGDNRIGILEASNINLKTHLMPRSWSVTSDSIAAFVAQKIVAEQLILIKVVDGLFDIKSGEFLDKVYVRNLESQVKHGIVDDYFAKILSVKKTSSYVVNGKFPHRVVDILRGKNPVCTKIVYD